MIKWLFKKIKSFYENEYEGKIIIEFSIYDILFIVVVLYLIWRLL